MVRAEVKGWTLDEKLEEAQFEDLAPQSTQELRAFVRPDGAVEFPLPALLATAAPP